jgi:hypothetical protein
MPSLVSKLLEARGVRNIETSVGFPFVLVLDPDALGQTISEQSILLDPFQPAE